MEMIFKFVTRLNTLRCKFLNHYCLRNSRVSYVEKPIISGLISIRNYGEIRLGRDVKINSSVNANPVGLSPLMVMWCSFGAKIIVGNNVGISNSLFFAKKSIVIDDFVIIGGGCQIFDTDFHEIDFRKRIAEDKVEAKPVIIGRGAFLGCRSIILKGVTIGEGAVVGAGSVVTKSIPAYEIWAGNPARFCRKI